ncbi:hypothetical protein VZT92_000306 [Zoarces viviparus]|uniref:Uncharacterized protein n=1 Tax=Zoarces viviparus TaxID=48416 RepID=A0AAW1G6G8_ZOAVI
MEGPLALWEVQEDMNTDYFDVAVVQSIKMTRDKAKALIAPVYKNSKDTKQLGSAYILYLGGGTPKITRTPTPPPPPLIPIR